MIQPEKIKISSSIGLQINNLVYNQHGEYHAVRRNDFSRFDHPDMGGNYGIYAIELNPEILIAAGFNKQNDAEWAIEYDNDNFIVVKKSLSLDVYLTFDREVYVEIEQEHIKYVHQLQNLYFSLTDKELEVKRLPN